MVFPTASIRASSALPSYISGAPSIFIYSLATFIISFRLRSSLSSISVTPVEDFASGLLELTLPDGPGLTKVLTADVRALASFPAITIWSSKFAAVFLNSAVTL